MINVDEELLKGLAVDDFSIYAKNITAGRFVEESNMDIYLKKGNDEVRILTAKIFRGRKPYLIPWVELFDIHNQLDIGGNTLSFFGSAYEEQLISLFSRFLDPAGRIFIEYYEDAETLHGLNSGLPPAITRLGFKLFEEGFTWFKNWYYPEGFMEGGQKIQGEKTSDDESKNRQLTQIQEEIKTFLEKTDISGEHDQYEKNAIKRAEEILATIES